MYRLVLVFTVLNLVVTCRAQNNAVQPPFPLKNAWFGVDVGSLNYPFSNKNLPANFSAQTVNIPHTAVRLTLLGYHFTKSLSARITYMRPVQWVLYKNINGDQSKHSVWMNIGGLTVKQDVPVSKKLSLYAETGLALITRHGFDIDNRPAVSDANYSTLSFGGGLEYHLNSKWVLNVYSGFCPGKTNITQPHTVFLGTGFNYNINPLATEWGRGDAGSKEGFPGQLLQVSVTTNKFGYGVNHFFAEGKIPVFWGGLARVEHGVSINYVRNVFHTKKTFSLNIGTSIGHWESNASDQSFYAVSIYPLMRFNVVRSKFCDYYFFYSVAGPSYLSKKVIDGYDTGRHFTFRDYMGIGGFIGSNKLLNAEISIGHFSNGNLYPNNAAVKIPLNFSFGYAFN